MPPDLGDPDWTIFVTGFTSDPSPSTQGTPLLEQNIKNGLRWRSRSSLKLCKISSSLVPAQFSCFWHLPRHSVEIPRSVTHLDPVRSLHDIALKPLWNGVRLLHIVGISFGNRMMSYAGLNEDTRRHLWRGGVGDGINRCVIWRNIVVLYWTQNLTPSHNHILYMPPSYYSPLPWDD
jgi:hypothetical protein